MSASDILTEAAGICAGDRNTTHGEKERSFSVIAALWNAYFDGRKTPGPITARDVAQCMVLLKIARSVQGTAAHDHFVDAAGYSAIAGEIAASETPAATRWRCIDDLGVRSITRGAEYTGVSYGSYVRLDANDHGYKHALYLSSRFEQVSA